MRLSITPALRLGSMAMAVLLAGCTSTGTEAQRRSGQRLDPGDFHASASDQSQPAPAAEPARGGADAPPDQVASADTRGNDAVDPAWFDMAAQSVDDTVVPRLDTSPVPDGPGLGVGDPSFEGGPIALEPPRLIDAKVGDINGRPIYAAEFFEPLAQRLRAEAQRLPPQQWLTFAEGRIDQQLRDIITDELLRAEAFQLLDEEQRQGLRAFLRSFRGNALSQAFGSETLARRRLEEATGQSLEEALLAQEERTLVRLTFEREIYSRVNISWRDVIRKYEQDAEKYNPDPVAVFRMVRVRTENADDLGAVLGFLGDGAPFEEIAAMDLNLANPDEDGLYAFQIEGELAESSPFNNDAFNEVARTLTPGARSDAFEVGPFTIWLALESFDRDGTSLYDAQREIYTDLLISSRNEEFARFIDRLFQRAGVTGVGEIKARLVRYAIVRYGPDA